MLKLVSSGTTKLGKFLSEREKFFPEGPLCSESDDDRTDDAAPGYRDQHGHHPNRPDDSLQNLPRKATERSD